MGLFESRFVSAILLAHANLLNSRMYYKLKKIKPYWYEIHFGDQVVALCGLGGIHQNWWYVVTPVEKRLISEGHPTVEDALDSYIQHIKKAP